MIRANVTRRLAMADGAVDLHVDLALQDREFAALYGRSGAGKTTVLRLLAGLTRPDSGVIEVEGETWFDHSRGIDLPPRLRRIGFVFQDYALFPNMSVQENLIYAMSEKDTGYLDSLLETMQLTALRDRMPETLSGGQRQRVALARALARRPRILLLDEPLSALDTEMRNNLQDLILEAHRRFEITTLLVSHDLSEVFKLSNKVYVIDRGRILASGHPEEMFGEKRISGKFRFVGEILRMQPNDVVVVITILIGNYTVQVIATAEEAAQFRVGERIIVFSKAFHPVLMKA